MFWVWNVDGTMKSAGQINCMADLLKTGLGDRDLTICILW